MNGTTPQPGTDAGATEIQLGPYRLTGVIGRGATGTVYLGTEMPSGGQVAVKVLDPALAALPGLAERLETESAVLATLSSPHVVRVWGTGVADGWRYLAMDYVDGASLRAVERQAGRLSGSQALGVVAGALEGLGAAHVRGLVHGDVKPENILVDHSGTATLVDFGQVVAAGGATEGGTPAYMSPEAARGLPLDARSDLYSMGVVLYEALAGRLPFEAENDLAVLRMHAEDPPPPIEGLSAPMEALLARALSKDPDARPADAVTFLADLEAAAAAEEGDEWKKRAGVAVLVAAAATGIDQLLAPTPAGAATPGTGAGLSPTAHAATSPAAKGGLIASHPVLAGIGAAVVVGALALGGVAIAHGGGKSGAVATTVPPSKPTFASVERAVCASANAADEEGNHCAILSMRVSTVDSDWVLVNGWGWYAGKSGRASVQEARSDLDQGIYNARTGAIIGPTNVGFCQGAAPVLSEVPAAVFAGWKLGCELPTGTTTTTTTFATSPTTSVAPTTTTTSGNASTSPSGFGAFAGTWGAHEQTLTISASGSGHLIYADLSQCPSCSFASAPTSTMDFQLASSSGGSASGKITAATDPQEYPVGSSLTAQITPGPQGGVVLQLTVGSASAGMYCNSTSAGQCGA